MSETNNQGYCPDRWVVVDYSDEYEDKDRYAILAAWGGSFVYGASWKRSSPIEDIKETPEGWEVKTASGSGYNLYKTKYGCTSQTALLAQEAQLRILEEDAATSLFNNWK